MWLPIITDRLRLIDALRKPGVNGSTSDSTSKCSIRTFETAYYSARTRPESDSLSASTSIASTSTSVTLDFISILEAEFDTSIDPSDGLVLGAQAITEDAAFEGTSHLMNGRKLVLTAGCDRIQ
ncbi:hypothetical protein F52700_4853 [Fusarium sp. NRRL 52700]|nr:hypothetical protein F52700_4853 [Fusarium sp. NRRL 52700]